MTDDLPARVAQMEKQIVRIEARSEDREKRERRIEEKVDWLIEAENRRAGRESAERREHTENREDRSYWAQWIQTFLPTGVWVGVFAAIAGAVEWLRNGGQ